MCFTERERRPGRHAGCRIAAGLGFGPQAPDSKPRAPSSSQRAISAPREVTCLPTHSAQPGLSGLRVGDLQSKSQIPHVSSGQLWTVAALRPPRWGVQQACKSAPLPLPSWGDSCSFLWSVQSSGMKAGVSNPGIQAQLGFAGVLVVLGFPNQFLGYECRGLGLQERCSLRSGKVPAS